MRRPSRPAPSACTDESDLNCGNAPRHRRIGVAAVVTSQNLPAAWDRCICGRGIVGGHSGRFRRQQSVVVGGLYSLASGVHFGPGRRRSGSSAPPWGVSLLERGRRASGAWSPPISRHPATQPDPWTWWPKRDGQTLIRSLNTPADPQRPPASGRISAASLKPMAAEAFRPDTGPLKVINSGTNTYLCPSAPAPNHRCFRRPVTPLQF